MIDTASNTVVATVTVGTSPRGIAITPDGKHAYVANLISNNVSVIDTFLVAVAPDGKHAYVTNMISNNVSVIDTGSDTVAARVPVGSNPVGVGILPPPPGVPYGSGHGRGGE